MKKERLELLIGAALLAGAFAAQHFFDLPWWAALLCYLIPYLLLGFPVLREAAEGVLHGEMTDENFLMSLATVGALAIGEYPEAVFVMLFYRLGECFEDAASEKSREAVRSLSRLLPEQVTLETPEGEITVSPEQAAVGDVMVLSAGQRIPLDGTVLSGTAFLDTSALTGEAKPREAVPGTPVASGCTVLDGLLRVRVTAPLEESTVARIMKLTEEAEEEKASGVRFVTRFARIYTPAVVGLAVVIGVITPLFTGDWMLWLRRALSLLVISCPCALVLSVPLTFFCGIGGASKRGILVKGSLALEKLSRAKIVALDKTGTLTTGSFAVSRVDGPEDTLTLAASAEQYSSHPLAQAIRKACPDAVKTNDVRELAGRGVEAVVDARRVLAGSARLMNENGISVPQTTDNAVFLSVDGAFYGTVFLDDTLKADAREALSALKKRKIEPVMLTGDRRENAQKTAEALGIEDVRAELLPEDKGEVMQSLKQRGTAVFVGDGINDALVLARADVGIAMGAMGAQAAVEAADVVLMDDTVLKVEESIRTAQKTVRIARENVAAALAVKLAVTVLSLLGFVGLPAAVFADVGVMVLTVMNAARGLWQRG